MQHGFKSGERVDAVIKVERLLPIDAKFPLDNFERMVEAEDDAGRTLHEKAFARDIKGHIDSIAEKYIKPAEGTYEFAFMYLPVEGIYYELVCGKTGALLQHAHERRVFPVSPTTFTAYLQVIAFGLKGMEFEQNAHEVMAYGRRPILREDSSFGHGVASVDRRSTGSDRAQSTRPGQRATARGELARRRRARSSGSSRLERDRRRSSAPQSTSRRRSSAAGAAIRRSDVASLGRRGSAGRPRSFTSESRASHDLRLAADG